MDAQQTDLALITTARQFPSIVERTTPIGFVFRADATTEELIAFGQSLCSTRAYLKFALGSLFIALVRSRSLHASPIEQERAQSDAEDYARAFAIAHSIDPKEFREIFGVARYYAPADLSSIGGAPLTFEHYREAMLGAHAKQAGGGASLPLALSYLTAARTKGWRYTELRRFIRSHDATSPEQKQIEIVQYGAVLDFMRFCKRELQEVGAYSPERASLILADLGEATFLYLDALREIARGAATTARTRAKLRMDES